VTSTVAACAGALDVESILLDDHALLRLRGDLDVITSGQLGEAARNVHRQGIPTLIIDLSQLDFIDASGLTQLVLALKRQRELGGEVALQSPTRHVRRVLEIVGFTQVFTIR
jgi:anti-sigma B factor antagonist